MVVSGSPKRWYIGGIVHPPIGRKNTTYIPLIVLAFWGVEKSFCQLFFEWFFLKNGIVLVRVSKFINNNSMGTLFGFNGRFLDVHGQNPWHFPWHSWQVESANLPSVGRKSGADDAQRRRKKVASLMRLIWLHKRGVTVIWGG